MGDRRGGRKGRPGESRKVANGLRDGLKFVALNGEAQDRAERLSAGQALVAEYPNPSLDTRL